MGPFRYLGGTVLPYLDESPQYDKWKISLEYYNAANANARMVPVSVYFCPSRSTSKISKSGDVPDSGGLQTSGAMGDYAGSRAIIVAQRLLA